MSLMQDDRLEAVADSRRFPKALRLNSRRLIEELFDGGHGSRSLAVFPLRAVYMYKEHTHGDAPVQLLVSVPKKRFHHAVDRNRVKRQIREAFRLHKSVLLSAVPQGRCLLLALVWLSDRQFSSVEVEGRIAALLQRIAEREDGR